MSASTVVQVGKRRRSRFNGRLRLGAIVLGVMLILGFILPLFSPHNPAQWNMVPRDLRPQPSHILGTTSLGQSVFWFLTAAIGNSLIIGLLVAALSTVIGSIVGLVAGFSRGIGNLVLTSLIDTFIAIPSLPILVLFAVLFQGRASVWVLSLLMTVFNWPWPARQVRSMVLSLRERVFIDVAAFANESTGRVIFKEILPHILPWAGANFTNTVLVAVSTETSLAVIGLSSLERPSLGTMIYWALQYQAIFRGLWWWIVPPVVATIALFIALFLVSTGYSQHLAARRTQS